MKPEILKNEEVQMNKIMFLIMLFIPVAAFSFVMLFLQGTGIDAVVFVIIGMAILIKLFEKKLGGVKQSICMLLSYPLPAFW